MQEYSTRKQKLKEKIDSISIFKHDTGVVRFRHIAKEMYDAKLDNTPSSVLLRMGGELSALYMSFGNKASEARADSEIAAFTLKQIKASKMQSILDQDKKYKVTEARNLAEDALSDEIQDALEKELIYKQWELVMDGAKTAIMFIQSALATKKSEAMINKDLH